MTLARYVKPKPWYFRYIPLLNKYTANSLYPFIFVPRDVYDDLLSPRPNPRHVALLIHEETHRKRQKQMGLFTFGIKYLFIPKFRFNEELLAVKEAMRYLKTHNVPFDFETKARALSGLLYLWPVSKHYAKEELEKVWNQI